MTYWTLMLITILGGPLDGAAMAVAYPSEAACIAAIRPVTDTLSFDYRVACQPTMAVTSSIRPKARPAK